MKNKQLMFALKLSITLLLLGGVISLVDLDEVMSRILLADLPLVIASLVTVLVSYVLSGIRWAWIARGLNLGVSVYRKIQFFFLGMFVSLFLPSTFGGDVVRGILLAKGNQQKGIAVPAAASVILERVNGLYAHILVVTVCMPFFTFPLSWWISWFAFAGVMTLGMLIYPKVCRHFPNRLAWIKQLPLLSKSFRLWWYRSFAISVVIQLLFIQAHLFLAWSVGLHLTWLEIAVMTGIVSIVAALPVSMNGFGIREAGYVGFATYFGANSETAAAMAALWVIVLVLSALPGLLAIWKYGGILKIKSL